MSDLAIQIYKNTHSNKAPEIKLPINLPKQDLVNGTLIKAAQGLFETNGVLLIHELFQKALIGQLHAAFVARYQPYFEDKDYADALRVGDKRRMLTLDFLAPFNTPDLYGNPFLLHLMKGLLGPDFVLGSFGAVISLPGADHQHIHRDHPALFENEALSLNLPSFAITAVVPLIDLTLETGSTRLWKGSHRTARSESKDMKDSYVPFLPTGSCYLMDYQLLHGGTPNVSQQVRPIIYMIYYRSWFQEAVNYEKQSRMSITEQAYHQIPQQYKFLFSRHNFDPSRNTSTDSTPTQGAGSENASPLTPVEQSEQGENQGKIAKFLLSVNSGSMGAGATALPLDLGPEKAPEPVPDQPHFEALTATEQAKKLGGIAKIALAQYGFKQATLKLISHGENTVFSVSSPDLPTLESDPNLYLPNQFILRIHRAHYLSTHAIASELRWLQVLRQEANLPIPEPVPTLTGLLWTAVQIPEIASPRVCSLTRWVRGRSLVDADHESQSQAIKSVGRLMGQLHGYAAQWSVPASFTRPHWNWEGLFGKGAGYSDNGDRVWALTPQPYRHLFETVGEQVKTIMASLGESHAQFGLIHGDFWRGNLLIREGDIRPIDFADCGFGYWGYDLARFLSDFSGSQNTSMVLDQLLSGYTDIRPFPATQLPHIKLFIVAQEVTLALWRINRAQDHPSFRSTLTADLRETAAVIEAFLG